MRNIDSAQLAPRRRVRFLTYCIAIFMTAGVPWLGEARAFSIGSPAPDIAGETWINSKPATLVELRGKVVLIEFWTYG